MSYDPDKDFGYVCSELDLGDISLVQGHDTPLGYVFVCGGLTMTSGYNKSSKLKIKPFS